MSGNAERIPGTNPLFAFDTYANSFSFVDTYNEDSEAVESGDETAADEFLLPVDAVLEQASLRPTDSEVDPVLFPPTPPKPCNSNLSAIC